MLQLGEKTFVLRWTKKVQNTAFWVGLKKKPGPGVVGCLPDRCEAAFRSWRPKSRLRIEAEPFRVSEPAEHSLRAAASGGQPEEGVGAPAKSEVFQAERAPGKFSGFRRLFWIFTNFVKAFPELFFLQKVLKMSTF